MLLVTGALTTVRTLIAWIAPTATNPTHRLPDRAFDSVAVPFAVDYLSWDEDSRPGRQTSLTRAAATGTTVDGWTGSGRQWADSPTAVGIARHGTDRAIVTVRLRVVPFTPTTGAAGPAGSAVTEPADPGERDEGDHGQSTGGPREPGQQGSNTASGPPPDTTGWTAQRPRWLSLAVPLGEVGGRVVVTATPALVGSPPATAASPAVPDSATPDDTAFAQRTRGVIDTLLHAYGTGELGYARAAGTTFSGLDGGAELQDVSSWRTEPAGANHSVDGTDGMDGTNRHGDVTVTWNLADSAGALTCTYVVELRRDADRWYLASIGPPIQAAA